MNIRAAVVATGFFMCSPKTVNVDVYRTRYNDLKNFLNENGLIVDRSSTEAIGSHPAFHELTAQISGKTSDKPLTSREMKAEGGFS